MNYSIFIIIGSVFGGLCMSDYVQSRTNSLYFQAFSGLMFSVVLYYSITNGYLLFEVLNE